MNSYYKVHFSEYIKCEMSANNYKWIDFITYGFTPEDATRLLTDTLPISPDIALKLSKMFGASTQYWVNLWRTCNAD